MKLITALAVCLTIFLQSVSTTNLLDDTPSTRKVRPKNCVWQPGECTPRSRDCGRGIQILTQTGDNCPVKVRRIRCKVACKPGSKKRRAKSKASGGLSPSEAGLVGFPVSKASERDGTYMDKLRDCDYVKSDWSPCDLKTRRMSRTLTLRKGDPKICKPNKTIEKTCRKKSSKKKRKNCVYSKGEWGACHPKTNLQSRTVRLVKGNPRKCPTTKTIARHCRKSNDKCQYRKFPDRCRKRHQKKADRINGCKYTKGKWGACDPQTNIKTRTLTLVDGNPKSCTQKKTKSKPCRKSKLCKYTRGPWQGCDPVTRLKSRVDNLKPTSPASCNATRNITKPCKQRQLIGKPCQYKLSAWGACNSETNERNRTKTLIAGDTATCQQTKIVTRPCLKANGKERCFFGSYGKYKPCQNGVKTKTRPVIAGPASCQRKAAKTKPCKKSKRHLL